MQTDITIEDVIAAGARCLGQLDDPSEPYHFNSYGTCTVGHVRRACGGGALSDRLLAAVRAANHRPNVTSVDDEVAVSHLTHLVEQETFGTAPGEGTDEHKREAAKALVERAIVMLESRAGVGADDLVLA